jgi:hypothetical protein
MRALMHSFHPSPALRAAAGPDEREVPDAPVSDPPAPIEQPVPVEEPPTGESPTREPPAGPDEVDPPVRDPRVPGQPSRKQVE